MQQRDRAILRLALPALGSLAIEPLYVLVDTAIVGRLGVSQLGGLALASTVLNTSFWVFVFLAYGTTARVAFLFGRGDRGGAASVAVQALWLAAAITAVIVPVIVGASPVLLRGMGGSETVFDAGLTYLRISAIGVPFVLVALVANGYLRGVHDTRSPLIVVLAANALNVVLELWFVFGLDLGIAGSAWGTVIAQAVAAAWFLVLIRVRTRDARAGLRPRVDELRWLVAAGGHLVVRTGALLAAFAAATSVAARIGPATLGGHQIAFQLWLFLALSVDALAVAGQALVGAALGAGDVSEARAVGVRLLRIGTVLSGALAVIVLAAAGPLPAQFTPDAAVASAARAALVVVAVMQVPAAAVFVLDGVLMGASDFRALKRGTLLALLGFLPFAFAVLQRRSLGIVGIWVGLTAWILVRLAVNARRFASGAWASEALRG